MSGIAVFLLALSFDLILGEPPALLHPVVWMGKVISFLQSIAPRESYRVQFIYGVLMVLVGIAIFTVSAYWLLSLLERFSTLLFVVVSAWLLKSTFSLRELARSATKIKRLLQNERLEEARLHMRSLVSRDVSKLDQPLLIAATVESVAENSSDGFVAPLLYYLVLGVPGALFYRTVNTCDSMVGYHGEYEYLGKFAARLDDVANFIPARLTGLLIVVAAYVAGKDSRSAWKMMWRDHSKTESPNAGWPMSAAAGALDVQLEKVGHYVLGDSKSTLTLDKIDGSLALMKVVATIWVLISFVSVGVRFAYFS
jgi:adenosylcobinamide-phosphate synthase